MNWLVTTLAAVSGTGALSSILAAGHNGQAWQERLVTAGFISVGVVIVASSVLVLWGFAPSFFLRGLITPERVADIETIATKHGVHLAPFYNGEGPIEDVLPSGGKV